MKTNRIVKVSWQMIALLIAAIVGLAACLGQEATQFHPNSILRPGDQIDGMILTTGAADVPPLWFFCSPTQENQHVTKTDCRVPPMLSKVAIGHVFSIANEYPAKLDWSDFTWELLVDEQAIELTSFGTYDFVMPTMSPSPSPVREVFKTFTAWDVVLTNLKPGAHTVHGVAQSETDKYTWMVNLIIEAPNASDSGTTR